MGEEYKIMGLAQIGMGVISVCDFCLTTNRREYDIYFENHLWELKNFENYEIDEDNLFYKLGVGIFSNCSFSEHRLNSFMDTILLAKRKLIRLDNCLIYDFPIRKQFFV